MKIQVLGTGCTRCDKLYAEAERAIARAGVSAELSKIDRIEEIMEFGVVMTPALVLNGEVKSAGRMPDTEEIISWLKAAR